MVYRFQVVKKSAVKNYSLVELRGRIHYIKLINMDKTCMSHKDYPGKESFAVIKLDKLSRFYYHRLISSNCLTTCKDITFDECICLFKTIAFLHPNPSVLPNAVVWTVKAYVRAPYSLLS